MNNTSSIIEVVALAIKKSSKESVDAYWYRREIDKSGYEVLHTQPENYGFSGEGKAIERFDCYEDADRFVSSKRHEFISKAVLSAIRDMPLDEGALGVAFNLYNNEPASSFEHAIRAYLNTLLGEADVK